jgi:hypothetical protein
VELAGFLVIQDVLDDFVEELLVKSAVLELGKVETANGKLDSRRRIVFSRQRKNKILMILKSLDRLLKNRVGVLFSFGFVAAFQKPSGDQGDDGRLHDMRRCAVALLGRHGARGLACPHANRGKELLKIFQTK